MNNRMYNLVDAGTGESVGEFQSPYDAENARHEFYRSAPGRQFDVVKPKPYVGMPATHVIGSDKYAGKIIETSRTGHRIVWQREGREDWVHSYSRRQNGSYYEIGSKYGYLILGVAKTSIDEGF